MEFPESIEKIEVVNKALKELGLNPLFVGGATLPFYLPELYWPKVRATDDVDVVVELITRKNLYDFEESLREAGFRNDTREEAPVCRWLYNGISVDIMSPDEKVMGFSNKWYREGLKESILLQKPFPEARVLSLPYFIASKLEAFEGRGKKDYQASHDLEDIISILETYSDSPLFHDFKGLNKDLAKYIESRLNLLMQESDFIDTLPGATFNRVDPEKGVETIKKSVEIVQTELAKY